MWIPLIVLGAAIVMIAVELTRPARTWPRVTGWWLRAALLNGVQVSAVFFSGYVLDDFIQRIQFFRLDDHVGVAGAAVLGYLLVTFIYYWWHRWRHEVPVLWRWFHQVHHSPQRIEVVTSFYKHPNEIFVNAALSSLILYVLAGCSPTSASYAVLLTGLAELVYHWNVSTPRWMGYIFQRPEMHCVHHQEHRHTNNFSDLPLWDMLFGTFENPKVFDATCGFGEHEHHLGTMLKGHDLTPELMEKARAAKAKNTAKPVETEAA
ncbi:MAG: sterol desaturase family protein [Planctomycetota bacterium]